MKCYNCKETIKIQSGLDSYYEYSLIHNSPTCTNKVEIHQHSKKLCLSNYNEIINNKYKAGNNN